jgi:hypothetical protein
MTQQKNTAEQDQRLDEPDVEQDGLQLERPENTGGREIEIGGRETGGREGLEPTRYGDWEIDGRCIDF